MSNDSNSEKPGALSCLDRRIYLTLVASLTVLIVWLSLVLHRSADQVIALQQQRDLAGIKVALGVPAEVLYCDEALIGQLALLRQEMFQRHGVERFVPYAFVVDAESSLQNLSLDDERVAMPVNDLAVVERGILEASWVRTVMATCDTLVLEKMESLGVGHFLAENPEVFRTEILPSLERLTLSSRPLLILAAAKAMLEWDSGSKVARAALSRLHADRDTLQPEARERLKQLWPRVSGE